jgi:hypothetical protein
MRCSSRSTKIWKPASMSFFAVVGVSADRRSNSFFSHRSQSGWTDMLGVVVGVSGRLRPSHGQIFSGGLNVTSDLECLSVDELRPPKVPLCLLVQGYLARARRWLHPLASHRSMMFSEAGSLYRMHSRSSVQIRTLHMATSSKNTLFHRAY